MTYAQVWSLSLLPLAGWGRMGWAGLGAEDWLGGWWMIFCEFLDHGRDGFEPWDLGKASGT